MAGHSVEAIHQQRKQFLVVLVALAVLTVITIWLSFFDWGVETNTTVGLIIASVKASLVALIFMHLKAEKKMIYMFLLLAAIMFIVCMFLTLLHHWDPIPGNWNIFSHGDPHKLEYKP